MVMVSVLVRPATLSDLASIVKVAMACFPQDNGTAALAEAWHRGGMAAFPKVQYFVAERDGQIVGYASWSFIGGFQAGVVELEQVGVLPEARGLGVASTLITESLTAVRSWLKEHVGRDLHAVKVDTSAENIAQRVYRKVLGAEVEAVLKNFLFGNDEVIMIKRFG